MPPSSTTFINDRQIRSKDQDLLNRTNYARKLCDGILGIDPSDGFVVGLSGKWGSGKSSTIEMILEWIEFTEIQTLNEQGYYLPDGQEPWDEATLLHLAQTYRKHFDHLEAYYLDQTKSARKTTDWFLLKQIRMKIGNIAYSEDDILRYFQIKHRVIDCPDTIIFKFSPWLIPEKNKLIQSFFADFFIVLSPYLGPKAKLAAQAYFTLLVELAETGTNIASSFGEIVGVSGLSKILSSIHKTFKGRNATLDGLKNDLERELRALEDRRILIIIDDLDRLTPEEAVQMISLTKSLGDLPNVIYLLSYDPAIINRQLETELKLDEGQGEVFLQKIVQVQFELGQPKKDELFGVFSVYLKEIYFKEKVDFDEDWRNSWNEVISKYVHTPRDIIKIISKYQFVYAAVHEQTSPLDLLVLTMVDVMDPTLYRWIQYNQSALAKERSANMYQWSHDPNVAHAKNKLPGIEKINHFSDKKLTFTSRQKSVIEYLFPKIEESPTFIKLRKADTSHPIQNPKNLSAYFQFEQSNYTWPRSMLERFKAEQNYQEIFPEITKFIMGADQSIQSMLAKNISERIESWIEGDNFDLIPWLIEVLKTAPMLIAYDTESVYDTSTFANLSHLLTKAVTHYSTIKEINFSLLLTTLFDEQYDFSLPSQLIRLLIGDRTSLLKNLSQQYYDDHHVEIKNKLRKRCNKLFEDEQLFSQVRAIKIIYVWSWAEWADFDYTKFDTLVDQNKHPEVFFHFDIVYSTRGDFVKRFKDVTYNPDKIHAMAQRIVNSDEFSQETRLSAQTYIERYNRGADEFG